MVREGEETTADTEVVMGEGMVTGTVILEGEVVTTETVVGVDRMCFYYIATKEYFNKGFFLFSFHFQAILLGSQVSMFVLYCRQRIFQQGFFHVFISLSSNSSWQPSFNVSIILPSTNISTRISSYFHFTFKQPFLAAKAMS